MSRRALFLVLLAWWTLLCGALAANSCRHRERVDACELRTWCPDGSYPTYLGTDGCRCAAPER